MLNFIQQHIKKNISDINYMKKIYSKVDQDKLISSIISLEDIDDYRTDICPDTEF